MSMCTILSRDDTHQRKNILDQFSPVLDEVNVVLTPLSIVLTLQALSAIDIPITTTREFDIVLALYKQLILTRLAILTKCTLFSPKYLTHSSG